MGVDGRFLLALVLAPWLSGCFAIVCPDELYCDGDVRVRCETECDPLFPSGLGSLLFDCRPILTETDCAADGAAAGLDKTCVDFDDVSICVDRERVPCGPDDPPTKCTEAGARMACTGFYDEGSWYETAACPDGETCSVDENGSARCG